MGGVLRVAIIGTRGIPANYGGFETFAQELGIRLAARQTPSLEARVVLAATAFRLLDYAEAHRALQPPLSAESLDRIVSYTSARLSRSR